MKKHFFLFKILFISSFVFAQSASYTDPAQMFNRLLIEKNGSSYILIGPYKVTGTPFLYGGGQMGNVFAQEGQQLQVKLNYNTYNQEVEVFVGNDKSIIKNYETVDSFLLKPSSITDFKVDLQFYSARFYDSKQKGFLQVILDGTGYKLFKKYKSELGYVSTNYVQSELRQFDLQYDYYFYNAEKKELKKLKANLSSLKKEFKNVDNIDSLIDEEQLKTDPEIALKKLFMALNSINTR